MLKRLVVKNLAIIKHSEIEFSDGFNVITGETGAGKSILINALKLFLGKRAKKNIIRIGETSASVEAIFEFNDNNKIYNELDNMGILLDSKEILIKRILTTNKQNRIYINGSLITLRGLEAIAPYLFGISSQSEQHELFTKQMHLDVLDKYSLLNKKLNKFEKKLSEYFKLEEYLKGLLEKQRYFLEKRDFYLFILDEIKNVAPKKGELADIDEELNLLENAEDIRAYYEELHGKLYSSRDSVYSRINELIYGAAEVEKFIDPNILSSLKEIYYSVENIAEDAINSATDLSVDQSRLYYLQERQDKLASLYSRYGGEETLFFRKAEKIVEEIDLQDLLILDIDKAKNDLRVIRDELVILADELHEIRIKKSIKLIKDIEKNLTLLGMKNSKLHIKIEKKDFNSITKYGYSDVEFLIKTSVNGNFEKFKDILSGGELSRILLSIKKVLSSFQSKCYIFDEIDQGTGGDIAHQIGKLLQDVSKKDQIIVITHLIQVAALADRHFYVTKYDKNNETISIVKSLNNQEREDELSRMIGDSDMDHSKNFIKTLLKNKIK